MSYALVTSLFEKHQERIIQHLLGDDNFAQSTTVTKPSKPGRKSRHGASSSSRLEKQAKSIAMKQAATHSADGADDEDDKHLEEDEDEVEDEDEDNIRTHGNVADAVPSRAESVPARSIDDTEWHKISAHGKKWHDKKVQDGSDETRRVDKS